MTDEQYVQELPTVFGTTQLSNYVTQSPSSQATPSSQTLQSVPDFATSQLEKAFGRNAQFRAFQQEVIDALVEHGKRLLLVQPAGWGKTFVYMTAAKALRERSGKVALIISPLLALIRNQIQLAEQYGVSVKHVSVSLKRNKEARREVLRLIHDGQVDAIITTPEQLSDRIFSKILKNIGMVVVDEAHCIYLWGYNFRPAYGRLDDFMDGLRQCETDSDTTRPILALSSTISTWQEDRLCRLFHIQEPAVRGLLPLSNLYLDVVHVMNYESALNYLARIIPKFSRLGIGVIYCLTVDKAETIAFWLRSKGVTARAYYHNVIPDALDLEDEQSRFRDDPESYRIYLEKQFTNNAISVLVSTSALGMGVDIPNIRYVIVFEAPSSLQVLYQQFGRAGRGTAEKSRCMVMYIDSPSDQGDVFFKTEDVCKLYTAIEKTSRLTISQLEMVCNLPIETIRNILIHFRIMKQQRVANNTDDVWQKEDDINEWRKAEVYIEEMRNTLTREKEDDLSKVEEFLKNDEICKMKLLCMDLGGDEIPEDYCCNNCTVCSRQKAAIEVNAGELSADDLDMIRRSDVRPLNIHKPPVPQNAFQKYTFGSDFLDDPRTDVCGISVSSYCGGGLAVELKKLLKKKTYWPMPQKYMSDDLIQAIVKIFCWPEVSRLIPTAESVVWVTYIPSTDASNGMMETFARRFATKLGYPFKNAVQLARDNHIENKWDQHNAYFRCRNLDGAYIITRKDEVLPGPVIVIDYLVRSGWTLLVVSELLRQAGSGPVFPVALLKTANHFKYE